MGIQSGTYRLRNAKSGTYFDASVSHQGQVHGWACRPENENQKWVVEPRGGVHVLRNAGNNQYASVSGTENGTRVQVSENPTEWRIEEKDGAYAVYVSGSESAIDLDMGRSENGTSISIWYYTGAHQQRWHFEEASGGGQQQSSGGQQYGQQQPQGYGGQAEGQYIGDVPPGVYRIHNSFSGTALDLSGAKADDGTPCIGYQVTNGANQTWRFESGSNGYRLKNGASGTYAGYRSDEQPTDGVLLTGNQSPVEWQVKQVDQGHQLHLASNPDLVLDLADGSKEDGAKICLWTNKNGQNQKWILELAQ